MKTYAGALVTDLDGTLADKSKIISSDVKAELEHLGSKGVLRVVATGRSLHGFRKIISSDFPIDYVAFSSGAGIFDWRKQKLEKHAHLEEEAVKGVVQRLLEHNLDFMVHAPIPDNHYFYYRHGGAPNTDFHQRVAIYQEYVKPWPDQQKYGAASQLLVVEPPTENSCYTSLSRLLSPLTVIRATSPLDFASRWIEIFPEGVSKASAAAWIVTRHNISVSRVMAVGNDYNDFDLLTWAAVPYLVGDGAEVLKKELPNVKLNCAKDFLSALRAVPDFFKDPRPK